MYNNLPEDWQTVPTSKSFDFPPGALPDRRNLCSTNIQTTAHPNLAKYVNCMIIHNW